MSALVTLGRMPPFLQRNVTLVIASIFVLVANYFLPLEEQAIPGGLYLFYLRMILVFAALWIPLTAWGNLHAHIIRGIARRMLGKRLIKPHTDGLFFKDSPLGDLMTLALLGLLVTGWLSFVGFQIFAPQLSVVASFLAMGYALFLLWGCRRDPYGPWRPQPWDWLPGFRAQVPAWLTVLFIVVMLSAFGRTLSFQNHEDAYLYHLSLSEVWIQKGHGGTILTNIFSGYATVIEHFYLLLKILVRGNAEQNALAQMFHAALGWGTMAITVNLMAKPYLKLPIRLCVVMLLLQADIAHHMFLPKNDAFLAALVMLALAGCVTRRFSLFISAACFAFAVKAVAAVSFLGIGLCLLLCPVRYAGEEAKVGFFAKIAVLLTGALAMIIHWLPFAIANYRLTGNPTFPLLNEIFHSPYAPPSLAKVVNEMTPFQISAADFWLSWGKLFTFHPLWLVFIAFLAFLPRSERLRRQWAGHVDLRFLILFAGLNFFLLLFFLGPFGGRIENRHFASVLVIGLLLGAIVLVSLIQTWPRKEAWALGLMAVLGLGSSGVDVNLKRIYRDLREPSNTARLLRDKPVIAMNRHLTQACPTAQPRVLAITITNVSYFLSCGEFWHSSKTYPLWQEDLSTMTGDAFKSYLEKMHVTHVITEDGYTRNTLMAATQDFPLETKVGRYSLRRVESITTREAQP